MKVKAKQKVTAYNYQIKKGKTFSEPTQTIQGETLTIQQLFKRAALQGHFPLDDGQSVYLDVENIEEITEMYRQGHDIVELSAFAEHMRELNKKVEAKIAEQKKELKRLEKAAEKEAILKEHAESEAKGSEKKEAKN